MENNKLSSVANSLLIIENQILIGDKILINKMDKSNVIDFLITFTIENGLSNFNAFLFISRQYPLSYQMINKYVAFIDFQQLSLNKKINWIEGLIDIYIDKLNWKKLSSNTSLPWSNDFIQKYENYWDWEVLCTNEKIPWNKEFILKYMPKFFENHNAFKLSNNNGLQWTLELINLFYDGTRKVREDEILMHPQICYGKFNCDSEKVSYNEELYNFRLKYHIKTIYRDEVMDNLNEGDICWSCVCKQLKSIDIDFIKSNNFRIDWITLSQNEFALNENLLESFKDKLDWVSLSTNKSLPWSISFIKKFEDYWDWDYLSTNTAIPWSYEIIDAFIDNWCWQEKIPFTFSANSSLPITVDFVDRYKEYIDFYTLQNENEGDFWTEEFIDKFDDLIEPWIISQNKGFPWSIGMIERYKEYSCFDFIHPKVVNQILPHLDDKIVSYVFDEIIRRQKI